MDRYIKRFDAEKDEDLMLCHARGVAYQRDMTKGRVTYDDAYMQKVASYDSEIEKQVIAGRLALLSRHLKPNATVLDYGCGTGEFVFQSLIAGYRAKGFDVMSASEKKMRAALAYSDKPQEFDAVTMWDTIEHMEDPATCLDRISRDAFLFVSLPIMQDDLKLIRQSKHYRPGEHLYYWTAGGFVQWMAFHEFRLLGLSDHEVKAGRDEIGALVFKKDRPRYRDFIGAYQQMHADKFYGSSAVELHFKTVADIVKRIKPKSILDFGCGRSDLVAHFWLDGQRTIERYDPAIRQYSHMPDGRFDLVLCLDVMEHIPMAGVDKVLQQIARRSTRCIFTISTKLARAKLPDGSNAHCTLLTHWEWIRWVRSYFQKVETIQSEWDHELILYCHGDK